MFSKSILLIMLPIFFAMIIAEMYLYQLGKRPFPRKQFLVSLIVGISYLASSYLIKPILDAINHLVEGWRLFSLDDEDFWTQFSLFFVVDFFYYWQHRFAHRVKWFWANHSTHHTPEDMVLSNAYRLSATSILSFAPFFYVPILLFGYSIQALTAMIVQSFFYQFFLHTDLVPKLGWLEYIFNTPSHHRVHHATNDEFLDKNFGGVLIIFDRIFGTYAEEGDRRENVYGLLGYEPTTSALKMTFQVWLTVWVDIYRAEGFKAKFFAAFGLLPGKEELETSQSHQQDLAS